MSNLLTLLSRLTTAKIENLQEGGSDGGFVDIGTEREVHQGANVVCSKFRGESWNGVQYHSILLDIDVPAYLIPSSTPGHSHLYIDTAIPEDVYFRLLDALAEAGVIEPGYASASKEKGATYLRLPWIKKKGAA